MSTRTIDTKETARLLRAALRHTWPGTSWSVRMDRGTAYGWLSVTWEDGPTDAQVGAVTGRYQSRAFDGGTDSYQSLPDGLATVEGQDLPEPVRYAVCGIIRSRRVGDVGWVAAAAAINAVQPGAVQVKATGGLVAGWITDVTAATLDVLPAPVDIHCAAYRLHHRIDLTAEDR